MSSELTLQRIYQADLAPLDKVKSLLAKETDVKRLADFGATIEAAKKIDGKNEERKKYWTQLQIWSERRLGEVLAAMPKAKGGQPHQRKPTGCIVQPVRPTLSDLGIEKTKAHRAQKLASLSEKKINAAISEMEKNKKEVSRTAILTTVTREQKESKREERRQENAELVKKTSDPVVAGARFATIVIDPPWDWGDEGDCDQLGRAKPTYATMTIEQLLAMPVGDLADVDCHIYLWITNRSLPKGFALFDRWGFRYVTCITWVKPSFGMGNYFRGQTEHVLFGVKGSQPLKRKDAGTVLSAARGKQHSSKPAEFYSLVESCSPGPYLEMFAREERKGWKSWGADVPA